MTMGVQTTAPLSLSPELQCVTMLVHCDLQQGKYA
jgi:hypothetical protein